MVEQAAGAVQQAITQGQKSRQRIDLLNPVNEKEINFNSTEPIDYPCSLQKEFDTLCSLTKSLLQRLSGSSDIGAKRLDDGGVEGEPCAVLYDLPSKKYAAVVFPTAERLNDIKKLAKEENRTLLIINPQWKDASDQNGAYNLVSDFGIGPWRQAAVDFLSQFEPTYVLKEKRIGSPGTINIAQGNRFATGGVVRILRSYPGQYENYAMAADGSSQLLGFQDAEPSYKELDALIKQGRSLKLEIFTIAKAASSVYVDEEAVIDDVVDDSEAQMPVSANEADVEAMDAATLRRMLAKYNQPTSGKLSKLRERLIEAMKTG